MVFIIESFRRLEVQLKDHHEKNQEDFRQTEAMFNLFSTIKIDKGLPPMRDWAILPDFANVIVTNIKKHKPKLILELGSGVSSVITGYLLKEMGKGRIITLEHDKKYADITSEHIKSHNLQKYVRVIYTPLKSYKYGNRNWLWYDKSKLKNMGSIDMLIIDGPPGSLQKLSRYPALPLLKKHLGPKTVIILDDAKRADEKRIVELWRKQYNIKTIEAVDTQKGAVILIKSN
jgi:predicted O-methyltransferase YrrM